MTEGDLVGKKLTHYRVLARIDEGGMGVVYRAHDERLRREVAIKVLPPHAVADERARRHMKDEALALARVKHQNVAAIYDLDHHDGIDFLVMELVEGRTLASEIAGKPLPERRILALGSQIADALQATHRERIIHRDLKPRNVLVTPGDHVKVLDFGIAKMLTAPDERETTETWRYASGVAGTLPYMAPEQLLGETADARTDVYSFGVVLFEMVTGRRPFQRQPETALVDEICHTPPPTPGRLSPGLSKRLEDTILKCLEKDPNHRYQSALELKVDLERARTPTQSLYVRSERRRRFWRRWRVPVLALLGISVVSVVAWLVFGPRHVEPVPEHRQLTFSGAATSPALAPDGTYFAYVDRTQGNWDRVMVQEIAGGGPLEVFSAPNCFELRWSPDGSELLCLASDVDKGPLHAFVVSRLGTGRRRFTSGGIIGTWAPDGRSFATALYTERAIQVTDKATGRVTKRPVTGDFGGIEDLDWSPIGNRIALLTGHSRRGAEIWTMAPDGTRLARVVQDSSDIASPRWSSRGDAIYYFRARGEAWDLIKVEAGRRAGATPIPLITGIQMQTYATLSRDDRCLLYARETRRTNLCLLGTKGSVEPGLFRQLTGGTFRDGEPSFSPDGSRVAFSREEGRAANIYVAPVRNGSAQQLTFLAARSRSPVWSPDGKEIAFRSDVENSFRIWRVSAAGGPARPWARTRAGNFDLTCLAWAPGSKVLYPRPGDRNYVLLDPTTEQEQSLLERDSTGTLFSPRVAPDGQHVAVLWNLWPASEVWVFGLADHTRQRVNRHGPIFPAGWSPDGRWIYVFDPLSKPQRILRVDSQGGETLPYAEFPATATIIDAATSPDGSHIVAVNESSQSDIWIVEDFDPAAAKRSGRGRRSEGAPASASRR